MKRRIHPQLLRASLPWGVLLSLGVLVAATGCREQGPAQAAESPDTAVRSIADTVQSKEPAKTGRVDKPVKTARVDKPVNPAEPRAQAAPPKASGKAQAVEFPPFSGKTIALIHTANMVGEIEPCG